MNALKKRRQNHVAFSSTEQFSFFMLQVILALQFPSGNHKRGIKEKVHALRYGFVLNHKLRFNVRKVFPFELLVILFSEVQNNRS